MFGQGRQHNEALLFVSFGQEEISRGREGGEGKQGGREQGESGKRVVGR